uniref:Uncharacterized protein n=1 Tax=viral metagenome TaxID=1070528 RepID=A0A6C0ETC2_9ZZZZ
MGICQSKEIDIEYDIELENFEPLELIKEYKYINLKKKKEYKFKNNLYWIYKNELYFK